MRFVLAAAFLLSGCVTDAATRLAYDIEKGAGRLGKEEGARYSIRHTSPSKSGECDGPYKLQLDQVGAMIVWCSDGSGKVVSSHSTSYHARYVDTPETYIVEKKSRETLVIELERKNGRAVVVAVS